MLFFYEPNCSCFYNSTKYVLLLYFGENFVVYQGKEDVWPNEKHQAFGFRIFLARVKR